MNDEKIRISLDELTSSRVDERIKRQVAIGRSALHEENARHAPPPPLPLERTTRGPSFLYNAVVYLALLGGVGGLCGWIAGQVAEVVYPDPTAILTALLRSEESISLAVKQGKMSQAIAEQQIAAQQKKFRSDPYVAIAINRSLSDTERMRRTDEQLRKDQLRRWMHTFLFFTSIALPLAFFLSIGDQLVCRNWEGVLICGSVALALGLVGGGTVSLFINQIYRALGGGHADNLTRQIFARGIGWSILGGFMAIAPGIVLRNFKRFAIGLAGGLIGGFVGGVLFDPLSFLTDNVLLSRFVGDISIGTLAGAGTGLIENAAKTGWLKVVAGLIAGKQFVLYRNPTIIGSSPQCEIYLFKDPQVGAQHAAIHLAGRFVEIEAISGGVNTFVNGRPISRVRLRNGDQIQIGSSAFVFQEKERNSSAPVS